MCTKCLEKYEYRFQVDNFYIDSLKIMKKKIPKISLVAWHTKSNDE